MTERAVATAMRPSLPWLPALPPSEGEGSGDMAGEPLIDNDSDGRGSGATGGDADAAEDAAAGKRDDADRTGETALGR